MLNLIEKTISGIPGREARVHSTREFLQLLILRILYDKGCFKNVAFVGGTALRLLYDLRRFSEDLDFSVVNRRGYRFADFLKGVVSELQGVGFSIDVKKGKEGTVESAMLKFRHILFKLGLSRLRSEKLSVKLDVDSNPPRGWNTEMSLLSEHFVFTVTHFDIPSLYAMKLHACFFRKYTKGRDFYDLLWHMGKRSVPNFELLNNAINQTEQRRVDVGAGNFTDFLTKNLSKVDFAKVRKDVERFIEDKRELKLLDKDLMLKSIQSRGM